MPDTPINKGIENTVSFVNYGEVTSKGQEKNYYSEQQKTLAQAAKEIQDLLNQLQESYPTKTPSDKEFVKKKFEEEINQNPSLKKRLFSAAKSGSLTALQEAVNHPLYNIVSDSLKSFFNP